MKKLPEKITSRRLWLTAVACYWFQDWHNAATNDNLRMAYAIMLASLVAIYSIGKLFEKGET